MMTFMGLFLITRVLEFRLLQHKILINFNDSGEVLTMQ